MSDDSPRHRWRSRKEFWHFLKIRVHKYRRLSVINRRRRPPIGKLVSVSFRVRVVRACERARRSCVGVWVGSDCQRWGSPLTFPPSAAPAVVVAFAFLMLYSWVLRFFGTDCCYAHGFFYLFLFLMVCSWVFCCFCTFSSYLLLCSCVFLSFLVFAGFCMCFFLFFHPSLLSISVPPRLRQLSFSFLSF